VPVWAAEGLGGSSLSVVVAFDVDGTLEVGDPKGPIKLEEVKRLKEAGFTVGIVGAKEKVEGLLRGLDFYMEGDPFKEKNLKELMRRYRPKLAIYVADRPSDREAALKAGFCYVKSDDFKLGDL